MRRHIRTIFKIFLGVAVSGALSLLSSQTFEPPSTPFLRIETEMHTARVDAIDRAADERYVVTASWDKTARVWDLRTGALLRVLRPPQGDGNDGQLFAVAISPDGTIVAVSGYPFTGQSPSIYLFDRASGRLTKHIDGLPVSAVRHLAYSADGRYLAATLSETNGIRIYRTGDNQEAKSDTDYGNDCNWAEFDRTGRLVTTSYDGSVRIYDANFRRVAKREPPGGKRPWSARFSPDGSKVAVGFTDTTSLNVLSGRDLTFLYAADTSQVKNGSLGSVAWSADGRFLYAGGDYGYGATHDKEAIVRWSDGGRGRARIWPAAHDTILNLRALSGGRVLFGSADPAVGMLDSGGRMVWQHTPETLDNRGYQDILRLSRDGSVVELSFDTFSPQGDRVQRVGRFNLAERRFQVDPAADSSLTPPRTTGLNVADWKNNNRPTLDGSALTLDEFDRSRSLAISSNAEQFLLGTSFGLSLYDRDGHSRWRQPMPAVAWNVNLTRDGRYAVAALGDGTIRWYAIEDGKEVLALFVHPDGKRWVAWTPEGFFDASPGGDSLVGYHLNHGLFQAGEFIRVDQVFNLFYRSDLVAGRLNVGGAEAVRAARAAVGDIATVLKGGLPPELALVSPAESQSDNGDFLFQFRVTDAGGGIGPVVYRINGVEVEGRQAGVALPGPGIQNRRFSLGPGTWEISGTVSNAKNQLESRSVTSKVTVAATGRQAALSIVSVGVSHYKDGSFDKGVRFAASDAKTLVERLNEQNKGLFSSVNPYPLYDGMATRDNIQRTIADAASHIGPDDVFVLYLAGHGTSIGGKYYFVPWEAANVDGNTLLQQSLDESALRRMLSSVNTTNKLLILDTCSAGAFSPLEEEGAAERLARITGRAVLEASASDQTASEYNGHSFLMAALLDNMAQAADPQGRVQVAVLGAIVAQTVVETTHHMQTPHWFFQGPAFAIARKP